MRLFSPRRVRNIFICIDVVFCASSRITTAFESAPPVSGSFDVAARLDKTTADAELGVSLVNAKGASAKLNWSGQFGDRLSNQSLAVKFSVPF